MWATQVASAEEGDNSVCGSLPPPNSCIAMSPQDEQQVVKTNQIVPESLTFSRVRPISAPTLHSCASFRDVFGVFGPVLVVIVLISIGWTKWLIVLTIAPNATANYLMDTSTFDDGQFWLIVDPDYRLKVLSVIGLVAVDVGYLFIFFKLVTSRKCNAKNKGMWTWKFTTMCAFCEHVTTCWSDVAGIRGKYRKYWNVTLKCVDLAMQTIMLCQLLQNGSSTVLVMGYTIFLCANAFSVAVTILLGNLSALHEILVDSLFDLVAAVLFPILVLLYSANKFNFDRKLFSVNMEVLPPGSFESNARLFVDPAERALFVASLNSLRILSFEDLILRLSMNFALFTRFVSIINFMVDTAKTEKSRQPTWEVLGEFFAKQRRVPKLFAGIFLAYGAGVVVYTQKSIIASQSACVSTMVDVYRTPQTFVEWENPVDVYDEVKALSRSGLLQNLQLINRALTRWPNELQKCSDLQYISLIYTETEWLPDWAKNWKNLQFLHIEGKQLRPSLTQLPDGLFGNMPFLQMIHLGVHPTLPHIPPLIGVPSLLSLTLAGLYVVTELPSLEHVPKLQRLTLPYMESLQTIPDLSPLKNLISLVIFSICPACCNGFIGACDPTDWFCRGNPDIGVSPTTCLAVDAPQPSAVSQSIFEKFAPSVCIRSGFDIAQTVDLLSQTQIEICGGVPYRRCEFPPNSGKFGICMNNRLQALMCVVNEDYIRLRKVQIQRNVGPPCDVHEEAWLGCH